MSRFLVMYSNDQGEPKAVMLSDVKGDQLPYGFFANAEILPGYNPGGGCVLIEMPSDDFRPLILDEHSDDEVEIVFRDL